MSRPAFTICGFVEDGLTPSLVDGIGWFWPFPVKTEPSTYPVNLENLDMFMLYWRADWLSVTGTITRVVTLDGTTETFYHYVDERVDFIESTDTGVRPLDEVDRVKYVTGVYSLVNGLENPNPSALTLIMRLSDATAIFDENGVLLNFDAPFAFSVETGATFLWWPPIEITDPSFGSTAATDATVTIFGRVFPLQAYSEAVGKIFDSFSGNITVDVGRWLKYEDGDGVAIYDEFTSEQLITPVPTDFFRLVE